MCMKDRILALLEFTLELEEIEISNKPNKTYYFR